jgi:hypothetical protein
MNLNLEKKIKIKGNRERQEKKFAAHSPFKKQFFISVIFDREMQYCTLR